MNFVDPEGLVTNVIGGLIGSLAGPMGAAAGVIAGTAIAGGLSWIWDNWINGDESAPASTMAKGGKQNIDNEYVRDVQNMGIQDPCNYLRELYNNTCDKKERQKIKQAMKRFNCDGKNRFE